MTESETCEYKKSLSELKEGIISIAAMLDNGTVTTGKNAKETPNKHQINAKELLLVILREKPESTVKELASQTGLTIHSVRHHMRPLQDSGILRRVGSNKTGRWEILA